MQYVCNVSLITRCAAGCRARENKGASLSSWCADWQSACVELPVADTPSLTPASAGHTTPPSRPAFPTSSSGSSTSSGAASTAGAESSTQEATPPAGQTNTSGGTTKTTPAPGSTAYATRTPAPSASPIPTPTPIPLVDGIALLALEATPSASMVVRLADENSDVFASAVFEFDEEYTESGRAILARLECTNKRLHISHSGGASVLTTDDVAMSAACSKDLVGVFSLRLWDVAYDGVVLGVGDRECDASGFSLGAGETGFCERLFAPPSLLTGRSLPSGLFSGGVPDCGEIGTLPNGMPTYVRCYNSTQESVEVVLPQGLSDALGYRLAKTTRVCWDSDGKHMCAAVTAPPGE